MTEKLVAVAITDSGSVAPHAGRALRWKVYVVADAAETSHAWTLDLTHTGCLHEWHVRGDGNRHPLHFVDTVLAASAGEGVRRRLQQRDTELLTTSEADPDKALEAYRTGTLPEGLPHAQQGCQTH
ncbi:MAG: nitrogen fixation protein [Cyanobacteria bacterium P01_H01_bin.26]